MHGVLEIPHTATNVTSDSIATEGLIVYNTMSGDSSNMRKRRKRIISKDSNNELRKVIVKQT